MNEPRGSAAELWWRVRPDAAALAALDALSTDGGARPAVFLQGAAVDWVADPVGLTAARREAADWLVCAGGWRRRLRAHDSADRRGAQPDDWSDERPSDRPDSLPAPFQPTTLAQWIDRICPSRALAGGPELLFEVGRSPGGAQDRIETLEPVLAAASLDRDVAVLVHGAGLGHLSGYGSEAWDQLTDFDLATLWTLSGEADTAPDRGTAIGAERAARLRRETSKIVVL